MEAESGTARVSQNLFVCSMPELGDYLPQV
jgi:hypothetical protein